MDVGGILLNFFFHKNLLSKYGFCIISNNYLFVLHVKT